MSYNDATSNSSGALVTFLYTVPIQNYLLLYANSVGLRKAQVRHSARTIKGVTVALGVAISTQYSVLSLKYT